MKLLFVVMFACLPLLAGAQEKLPQDVAKFVENAQMCEHFAGEWDDNDKARQREITQAVASSCGQAQRQWKRLRVKYAKQPKLQQVIAENANDAVRSFRK
ncbi:hypothetical protein JAB5_55000 [Janthinobacterium sp. HH103]|uniref:Uncharacterized protein n=1 Tax=Janthinobacterium agaricidamnosum TaxID=55508 RepID=A0A3G2EF17_9BURK|nr:MULTISPECIES: hypothetical protein [Janthinobacterium]AYM78757.1 hypothetical protein D9M09_25435 [Janthinobacterium agaricidamnosum]MCC7684043.1 hypothetical protein [Janthinobacterium sp. FW305-128]OEZ66459.1 hypothetical protein JAB2_28890 [Janthinobacterium sp. HH100]OEZ66834.1 hypothetical protein JAB5_55000 [Janthinobacterium sp. HH103]QOU76160.1 hypothetical protein JAB4_056600 [Janthinobacterium sp. HH102]